MAEEMARRHDEKHWKLHREVAQQQRESYNTRIYGAISRLPRINDSEIDTLERTEKLLHSHEVPNKHWVQAVPYILTEKYADLVADRPDSISDDYANFK